jgi:hypothetical protein
MSDAPVVLVTGGSRGIGAAVSRLAARQGWRVAVNYASNRKAADAVVAAIAEGGGEAVAIAGDVGKTAGEDADVVSVAVHLDAGAVELVLHRCLTGDLERGGRRRCGRREHRQHRAPHHQADGVELVCAAGEGDHRGLTQIARQHRGAAHARDGTVGGSGDRVEQNSAEGSGAQLTEHRPRQEVPFDRRRTCGERGERRGSRGRRS